MTDGDETCSGPILTLSAVSKTFPGTKALREVELAVERGEIHALVGQNGSGKSTLIKILAGFHQPDPGASAHVDGEVFHLGDSGAAHAAGLRFVHQDLGLVGTLDCVDNLALGFGYTTGLGRRIAWRKQRAEARQALRRFGCEIDIRKPASSLSASEKTTVAIVRAMQDDSRISLLILDEPTATMPRPEVNRLFDLIRRVASHGHAVLIVSHHLDEVFTIADRVTVLRDGRWEATRDVAELDKSELVMLMTGGLVDQIDHVADPEPAAVALVARGLSGRVLRDFDLELHEGEVLGVAGLDGSGRDEICGLIFGSRERDGSVSVGGRPVPGSRPDLSISSGMALVPANRRADGLVMTHTVRENLVLADVKSLKRWWRVSRSRERRVVRDWIERLAIQADSMEAVVESLSGGNQQKVVMGKWLQREPAVLLLDEPTQGVDVGAQAELHRLIRAAADRGTAVLVCSSDEDELSRICDRVIVLCGGTIEADLRGSQISAMRIAQHTLNDAAVAGKSWPERTS
jgi:ribose transport system ATP-binding protein